MRLDYDSAVEEFGRRRNKRLCEKKVANNTYLFTSSLSPRPGDEFIGLRLHGNTVAIFYPGSIVKLFHAGWQTHTTKDRLNYIRGIRVYSLDGEWFIDTALHQGPHGRGKMNRPLFYNAMQVHQDSGEILSGVLYKPSKRKVHPQGHQAGVWTPPVWEAGRLERLAPSL